MSLSTITFTIEDGIGRLTLNRPEKKNALSSVMREEITRVLGDLPAEVEVVVLRGAGDAFCSGQDLSDSDAARDIEGTLRREYEPMLRAIANCPVPVIAAVNGVAAGAGANLALVADVVIATESASFIQAFTRIGLIPDAGGTWFMPRLVGHARAMGAMLFAEPVSAKTAESWGMIWKAVPDADFDGVVTKYARQLADGPTGAFLGVREALRASATNSLDAQLETEARLQGIAGRSADFFEGVQAFLEKRLPKFARRGGA